MCPSAGAFKLLRLFSPERIAFIFCPYKNKIYRGFFDLILRKITQDIT